jgi:hypothetical protein
MKKYENYQDPIFTCLQGLLQGCLQHDIQQRVGTIQGNAQVN